MSSILCERPISMEIKGETIRVRCRKCAPCVRHRQMEWKNRMLLECYGKNYRPMFLTWTFKPSEYVDSRIYVLKETQKLYKKIRRLGHDMRYFTSIERGTKKGRLHAHSIIWSKSLSKLNWTDNFWTLYNTWNKGGIKLRYVNSPGAFYYTAKYIIKDLVEDIDMLTGHVSKSRNYTFSNRPRLGNDGISRWEYLTDKMFHVEQYPHVKPMNWFHMSFLGKLEKAYIPTDNWTKYLRNKVVQAVVPDLEIQYDEKSVFDVDQERAIIPVTQWVDENIGIIDG